MTMYDRCKDFACILGLLVKELDLKAYDGMIYGHKIAIRQTLPEDQKAFILAHEIAHFILHRGDLIANPDPAAEREADILATRICSLLRS